MNNQKAKEEAKRLVDRFKGFVLSDAQACALICVEEIIKTKPNELIKATDTEDGVSVEFKWTIKYWEQVKEEIKKL